MLSDPVILILVSKFLYLLCLKPQIGILLDLESWNIRFLPPICFEVLLTSTQLDCCILPVYFRLSLIVTGNEVILFLLLLLNRYCYICVLYVLEGMYICLETLYWVFVFLPNLIWIMDKRCMLACCLLRQILGIDIQIYSRERQRS